MRCVQTVPRLFGPRLFGPLLWGPLLLAVALASGCSTTEQQVRDQIAVTAANDIGTEGWTAAVDQLVTIGRPAARQLVLLLDPAQYKSVRYTEFRDEMARTRTAAAAVLGRIRHNAASASLDDRITTAYWYPERVASIRAVGDLNWTAAAIPLLEAQLKDVDPRIRLYAAVALLKLGENTAVDTIRQSALSSDAELCELAAAELESANFHGVDLLVELGQRDGPNRERLQNAVTGLKDLLLVQVSDDDPEVRRLSARALGTIGDPSAGDILADLLDDSSNLVRFNAASSLSQLGDARGTEFLFDAVSDADPILRVNAVKSLIRVQRTSQAVQERLVASLTADDPFMRSGAAQVLGEALVEDAVAPLLKALEDEDSQVRCNAVIALGRIGAPESRASLEELTGDADATVAYYAEWALASFGAGS